jgi:hypothetical protein
MLASLWAFWLGLAPPCHAQEQGLSCMLGPSALGTERFSFPAQHVSGTSSDIAQIKPTWTPARPTFMGSEASWPLSAQVSSKEDCNHKSQSPVKSGHPLRHCGNSLGDCYPKSHSREVAGQELGSWACPSPSFPFLTCEFLENRAHNCLLLVSTSEATEVQGWAWEVEKAASAHGAP